MEKRRDEPKNGMLTNQMDIGTKGFDDFQSILLKKSRERSNQQKRNIKLLSLKYERKE
jgi:hypothetical protein